MKFLCRICRVLLNDGLSFRGKEGFNAYVLFFLGTKSRFFCSYWNRQFQLCFKRSRGLTPKRRFFFFFMVPNREEFFSRREWGHLRGAWDDEGNRKYSEVVFVVQGLAPIPTGSHWPRVEWAVGGTSKSTKNLITTGSGILSTLLTRLQRSPRPYKSVIWSSCYPGPAVAVCFSPEMIELIKP